MNTLIRLPRDEVFRMDELIRVRAGQVASMDMTDKEELQISVFAFDGGEGISEEVYPGEMLYYALSGAPAVLVSGEQHALPAGSAIRIDADVPHELIGAEPYKLFQILIGHGGAQTMNPFIKHLEHAKALALGEQVGYEKNQVVSLTLTNQPEVGLTLFAFDAGTKIGPHAASGDAMPMILEGEAEVIIGDQSYAVKAGETIVMPANIQHTVKATTAFKMLLVVVRPKA